MASLSNNSNIHLVNNVSFNTLESNDQKNDIFRVDSSAGKVYMSKDMRDRKSVKTFADIKFMLVKSKVLLSKHQNNFEKWIMKSN